MEIFYANQKQ